MIRKLINQFRNEGIPRKSLDIIAVELNSIRQKYDYIAICPENTEHNWLGIKRGTLALFGEAAFCIDQYYSNAVYSEKELKQIAKLILDLKFKFCFFRGFPPYFEKIIEEIHKEINVWVLYAGPVSEFVEEKKRVNFLNIIQLAQRGKIKGVGFNKIGLAELISDVYGIKTGRYILKAPKITFPIPTAYDGVNIGVLGGQTFNKNIHSQVLAGIGIKKAKVHVVNKSPFDYLKSPKRIRETGYLNHQDFIKELSKMTINSYLAFSESWGNVILESAAVGVPCLTTNNNGIYKWDEELNSILSVKEYDNLDTVRSQFEEVILLKDKLSPKLIQYCELINTEADTYLTSFLL